MEEFNKQKHLFNLKNQIEKNDYESNNDSNSRRNERIGSDSDSSTRSRSSKSSRSRRSRSRRKEKVDLKKINDINDIPFHMLDEKTQKFRRMEKYGQLLAIKSNGIKLTQEYNINSDYDEMCFEVDFWRKYQKKKQGVHMGKGWMMKGVQAIEFLNKRYDPFGLKLEGWHDHMQMTGDSYDTVFGELYDKHNIAESNMDPWVKLIFMIVGSAAGFHAAAKVAETTPGIDDLLKKDPNLLANINKRMNNGIGGSSEQKGPSDEERKRQMYETMRQIKEQRLKYEELQKKQESVLNSNNVEIENQIKKMQKIKSEPKPSTANIMERIKAQHAIRKSENAINENFDAESSSSESDASKSNTEDVSESLTLDSNNRPKRRRRRQNKSVISITT